MTSTAPVPSTASMAATMTHGKDDNKQLMREASHLLSRLGQHAVAERLRQAAQ